MRFFFAREAQKAGPDVWIFRRSEINAEGKRVNRKDVVGTVELILAVFESKGDSGSGPQYLAQKEKIR